MLKMVMIPDWVLRAVERNGAPLETVLDAFALSSILSPRDVAFYLASTELAYDHILHPPSEVNPSYAPMFRALPRLHINNLDWIEDALKRKDICEKTHERLALIHAQYQDIMLSQNQMVYPDYPADSYIQTLQSDYVCKTTATLWRDPQVALSSNIPEEELKGLPKYVPDVRLVPIVIKKPETLRCTGLDRGHMDAGQPASRVTVMGALFSPADTHESPLKVYQNAYSQAANAVSQFTPLHDTLNTTLLDGYINAYLKEKSTC